jgi:D-3-phosphoglycerate dehydrogenase
MSATPRLVVLNGSCLDVVDDSLRDWIVSQGVELLAEERFRSLDAAGVARVCVEADGVILPSSARDQPRATQMAAAPRLLVCSIAASGFEWFDVDAATNNGIVVTYAPGREGAEVVADMAWGLMFAVARQIPFHHQHMCTGGNVRDIGMSVYGKTLGVIGLGNIGKCVARRARGFDMRLIATDPAPDPCFVREHGVTMVPLDELLAQADFVSLHMRLTEATRNTIGERELSLMKRRAILINTARQELIDDSAMVAAIQSGQIAGAGLDDPPTAISKPLCGLPNVVFTPHLGNRAIEGMRDVFRTAVTNALAVFRGERPEFVVNPEVYQRGARPRR